MKQEIENFSVRTDLAIEAKEMVVEQQGQQLDSDLKGVIIKERTEQDVKISEVTITDEGSKSIGKKQGII